MIIDIEQKKNRNSGVQTQYIDIIVKEKPIKLIELHAVYIVTWKIHVDQWKFHITVLIG